MKLAFKLFFAILLLHACQQPFTIADLPTPSNSVVDTSTICTVTQYQANGTGNLVDSIKGTLKNASTNGIKKITFTELDYSFGDTVITTFLYDNLNQLIETKTTYASLPNSYDKDIYTWQNGNLLQHKYDSAGSIKFTYDYYYTSEGNNTKVSYIRTPSKDVSITNGSGVSQGQIFRDNLIVNSNFTPLYSEYYSYYYTNSLATGNANITHRDTAKNMYNLDATGNLISIYNYNKGVDSTMPYGFPLFPATIVNRADTIISNYTRNANDNGYFTNIYKALYTNKIFILDHYMSSELVSNSGVFLPEGLARNFMYVNQSLNKLTKTYYFWVNGIPQNGNGNISTEVIASHQFDASGRLIKSIKYNQFSSPPVPQSMIKIIYP